MLEDFAFGIKINYVSIFLKNLNLEEYLNCFIGSKVTCIVSPASSEPLPSKECCPTNCCLYEVFSVSNPVL